MSAAVVRNRIFASLRRRHFIGAANAGLSSQYSSSSVDPPTLDYIQKHYVVRRRGDPGYGSREYLLMPPGEALEDGSSSLPAAAALLAHRNILFGARKGNAVDETTICSLSELCPPLLEIAVKDAGENGDQPQAIANLTGLSDWVKECLEGNGNSKELSKLDPLILEAVQAIATGIPRKGHSVVGVGTYRDAEQGWKALATEFVELNLSEEANLYQMHGAQLVGIEHLADKNPDYLKSAGGAMARLFFL